MGVSDDPENPYKISDERFYTDTDKWKNEVESLIGPTDIYIYPNGNDVADWHPYTEETIVTSTLLPKVSATSVM